MNPIFAFRFDQKSKNKRTDVLVLFHSTQEIDVAALVSEIENEIIENLVPDEIVILVREIAVQKAQSLFDSDSTLEILKERVLQRARVTLLGYGADGGIRSTKQVFQNGSAFRLSLETFKRRALTSICLDHGAFVEATPAFHFENPSKRHTEHFIRLSNILVRSAEISFVAFCTLPYIKSVTRIAYLDTPSLYAIVSAINDQICSFEPGRSPILADNFRSYLGVKNYDFKCNEDAIVLISASSSGGLANELEDLVGFDSGQIVHLLSLAEVTEKIQIVCSLQHDKDENPDGYNYTRSEETSGQCTFCDAGSKAIKLQGDQFDIAGPQPEPLLINRDDRPKNLQRTLENLVGCKVFSVGLGQPQTKAPRQFHIEADNLFSAEKFLERLDYILKRSIPAKSGCVVHLDEDSIHLAETVAAIVSSNGSAARIIDSNGLDAIEDKITEPVVIVAATIESGRSLLDVSRDLRNICPAAPLIYIIGLEKSSGSTRRNALPATLVQCDAPIKHDYQAVERLLLPGSFESHAWQLELRLIQDPKFKALLRKPTADRFEKRICRLKETSKPMSDSLFLSVDPKKPLALQKGFVFWPKELDSKPHTQADVYFTIASVLQQLRANSSKPNTRRLQSNWFQQSLLSPENFGRYNDGIIQACLLRAAHAAEMNYAMAPEMSREMARIIRRIVTSAHTPRGESAVEFLLALATKRMTLYSADTKELLKNCNSDVPAVQLMLKAVSQFTT